MKLPVRRKRITAATIKAGWKKKARALTQPQRQQAFDMLRSGATIGSVQETLEIDTGTVLGILELCTVKTVITSLKEVAP
ncbi:hypothetical protein B0W47_07745 [Komagataeibacter nataicola]|uniref:Uncharacterized protein n=1 Tax=Komagataeibacter nataicola TaxID=265960 RepID=A0A9N7C9J8_9PROT|nr:hypothetical protein [Komagataeibacter nataicola]AQU87382.1 hypothetical protein B0W47_07745 [Komagataeibacter nataicola]PYD65281.1 hypothetical protein CDI09_14575 [Komagataeibacter nataicola]WNM09401.1 hypothetical protein RI056_05450 [Komagataeibacter nataicola]GBR18659.1 hypothetical protein AA0616_1349 [Komagataeibacter nataicola NRIC 0616]